MTDLAGLAENMRSLAGRVRKGGDTLKNTCALAILSSVVMRTPVGNKNVWLEPKKAYVGYVGGRARANWYVGVGAPNTSITDAVDPAGSGPISAGRATIEASGSGDIHLNNNLPYIVPLNEGWSSQAPAGFVDVAIMDGLAVLSRVKITE